MTVDYYMPPDDYSPPTACETCGRRIAFVPVIGGHAWSHLVGHADDYHPVIIRAEGYFDTLTGETVIGNPLRRRFFQQSESVKSPDIPPTPSLPDSEQNRDFDRGYDAGWQDAKDDGFDRDKLATAVEDYMSSGGHEFRAYDLADCIIRHLVGEMKL